MLQVTLAKDAVASVPLQYNTSALAPGVYQSVVQLSSNDPLLPVVNLTVRWLILARFLDKELLFHAITG